MKYVFALILVVLNLINVPLNKLYLIVQKWYLPMWKKDKVIYFAFAPFYWVLFGLVFIISYPYEKLINLVGH